MRRLVIVQALLFALSLCEVASAQVECKPTPECTPCALNGPDNPKASKESLSGSNECQPSRRVFHANAAACIGVEGDCKPSYKDAIALLKPLECVQTSGPNPCNLSPDWATWVGNGRNLLHKIQSEGALVISFTDLPEGATVQVANRECKLRGSACQLLGLEPGSYELVVKQGDTERARKSFNVQAGQVTTATFAVDPAVPAPVPEPDEPGPVEPVTPDVPVVTPPPKLRTLGLWALGSVVVDEHVKDSFGGRGQFGLSLHVAGPFELQGGVVVGKRFAGVLANAALLWGSPKFRYGAIGGIAWLPVNYKDAPDKTLFGFRAGGQLQVALSNNLTFLPELAFEGYPSAANYDGGFLVVSLGAEWRVL